MSYFKSKYKTNIVKNMQEKFGIKNIHDVPFIEKISINIGLGQDGSNKILKQKAFEELSMIACQTPVFTVAKKSLASFKIREDQVIGLCVTLRRDKMYNFLQRLVYMSLPRIHDFTGFTAKSLDSNNSLNIGISDSIVFAEISEIYDKVVKFRGMNISFHIKNSKTKNMSVELLKCFDFPISI